MLSESPKNEVQPKPERKPKAPSKREEERNPKTPKPKVYTNTGFSFPPLRIVEDKMTPKQILETFNTAFGGDAVIEVTKGKDGARIIHFDQGCEQRMYLWDEFYEALDEYGAVWIKAEYLGDEEYPHTGIAYLKEPREGYWEVHYAKKTPPRRATALDNPRVGKDGKLRHSPARPWPPVVVKKCTCCCSCGAKPMGTRI